MSNESINELGLHRFELDPKTVKDVASLQQCLLDNSESINDILNQHGAILIDSGNIINNAKDFEETIKTFNPKLRDYIGGTSPREAVKGKVFEATKLAKNWSIPLHQEMAYTLDPPDRISFFCEQPALKGSGFSTIGDMRKVKSMISPSTLEKFARHGVQLRRTLPSEATQHKKPGVKKLWSEVFGTHDKNEVDRLVKEKGWSAQWIESDTLQLWQEILPACRTHPASGEEIWFNQAHFFSSICMMEWAKEDGRIDDYNELKAARENHPEMLDQAFYGNGEQIEDEVSLEIYSVLKQIEINVELNQSEILILDNMIYAHGRTSFEGDRRILVSLLANS